MNATSLYVSVCRVMVAAAGGGGLADLYRLAPYLRQALSCCVCGGLLRQAVSPGACPHSVCRDCRGGRSRVKPACARCSSKSPPPPRYLDNCQLRILLQSYKRLCQYFSATDVFRRLAEQAADSTADTLLGLVELVQEGAGFTDGYESTAGLSRSAYSILPCVYTNSATQTPDPPEPDPPRPPQPQPLPAPAPVRNPDSALYSVMYPGQGNKITIKRKPPEEEEKYVPVETAPARETTTNQTSFKKPTYRSRNSSNKRKGCRCGNATATPGKLTCCGQRCPCYVDSKACSECKCKGCRNPHRADGLKVRPHIPQLENIQLSIPIKQENSPSGSNSMESLDAESYELAAMDQTLTFDPDDIKTSDIKVYTSQLQEISADLPAAIMMDEDISPMSPTTDDDSNSPQFQDNGDASSPLQMKQVHNIFLPFTRSSPCLSHQDNTSDIEVEV